MAAAFRIQRVTLVPNKNTEILAPFLAESVQVGNATLGDMLVKTALNDPKQQLTIGPGLERPFNISRTAYGDVSEGRGPCFWLVGSVDGEAVLIWW